MSHSPVILCATDLGPSGHRAVAHGRALAKASGGALRLLHVAEDPATLEADGVPASMAQVFAAYRARLVAERAQTEQHLDALCRSLVGDGLDCAAEIRTGRPWEVIVSAATEMDVDVCLVGPHGDATGRLEEHPELARLLGSTADRVVRHADRPVWVCVGPAELGAPPYTAVVGVDFGESTSALLEWAAVLEASFGMRVVLVHVLSLAATALEPMSSTEGALRALTERAAARLDALAAAYGLDRAERMVVPGSSAYRALVDESEARGATVLVASAGNAPGWARALLGTTAERCLHHAHVPVCVIRRPGETFRLAPRLMGE